MGEPLDKTKAAIYGRLVQAAYLMAEDKTNTDRCGRVDQTFPLRPECS